MNAVASAAAVVVVVFVGDWLFSVSAALCDVGAMIELQTDAIQHNAKICATSSFIVNAMCAVL